MEFRLNSKFNCSFFDLISGETEPKQTKGLGLLLAKSPVALELFLRLLKISDKDINGLKKEDCIVHCEMPIANAGLKGDGRADIVLWFLDKTTGMPKYSILIEAKRISLPKAHTLADSLEDQLNRYVSTHAELGKLQASEKLLRVTLTKENIAFPNNILSITWSDVIETFSSKKHVSGWEKDLINDYTNFLTNINGSMKFYDEDILSIPAGRTIKAIKDTGIYECPSGRKGYNTNRVAQYLAFRGKGGVMNELYKVKKIYNMKMNNDAIDVLAATDPDVAARLKDYIVQAQPDCNQDSKIYVLDLDATIQLPYTVKPQINPQGISYYSFKDFFTPNGQCKSQGTIILPKKKKSIQIP